MSVSSAVGTAWRSLSDGQTLSLGSSSAHWSTQVLSIFWI